MILQSGHMPSVLQQLCRLPFNYFSDKTLQAVLFPTLVACCHGSPSNQSILTKEMSYQVIDDGFVINLYIEWGGGRRRGGRFQRLSSDALRARTGQEIAFDLIQVDIGFGTHFKLM